MGWWWRRGAGGDLLSWVLQVTASSWILLTPKSHSSLGIYAVPGLTLGALAQAVCRCLCDCAACCAEPPGPLPPAGDGGRCTGGGLGCRNTGVLGRAGSTQFRRSRNPVPFLLTSRQRGSRGGQVERTLSVNVRQGRREQRRGCHLSVLHDGHIQHWLEHISRGMLCLSVSPPTTIDLSGQKAAPSSLRR